MGGKIGVVVNRGDKRGGVIENCSNVRYKRKKVDGVKYKI